MNCHPEWVAPNPCFKLGHTPRNGAGRLPINRGQLVNELTCPLTKNPTMALHGKPNGPTRGACHERKYGVKSNSDWLARCEYCNASPAAYRVLDQAILRGFVVVLLTEELGVTKISPPIKTRHCKADARLDTSKAFLQALFGLSTLRWASNTKGETLWLACFK